LYRILYIDSSQKYGRFLKSLTAILKSQVVSSTPVFSPGYCFKKLFVLVYGIVTIKKLSIAEIDNWGG